MKWSSPLASAIQRCRFLICLARFSPIIPRHRLPFSAILLASPAVRFRSLPACHVVISPQRTCCFLRFLHLALLAFTRLVLRCSGRRLGFPVTLNLLASFISGFSCCGARKEGNFCISITKRELDPQLGLGITSSTVIKLSSHFDTVYQFLVTSI